MKKLNRIKERVNAFFTRLDICIHILLHSKHERVLQYLSNRLPRDVDPFYKSDEYLLNTLRNRDEEFECLRNQNR